MMYGEHKNYEWQRNIDKGHLDDSQQQYKGREPRLESIKANLGLCATMNQLQLTFDNVDDPGPTTSQTS